MLEALRHWQKFFETRWQPPTPLDLLLPPCCPSCKCAVNSHNTLCVECWNGLDFATPPLCLGCGMHFEYDLGSLCAQCLQQPPPWHNIAYSLHYNEKFKLLISKFKYSRNFEAVALFSSLLMQASSRLPEPHFIVPVPLHPRRLFQRQFNQAAVLAQRLAQLRGTPQLYAPLLLKRHRYRGSQKGQSSAQRWQNVRNSFFRPDTHSLAGRKIWLIDDVITTSATIRAASQPLLQAGAQVNILCLARVKGRFPQFKN